MPTVVSGTAFWSFQREFSPCSKSGCRESGKKVMNVVTNGTAVNGKALRSYCTPLFGVSIGIPGRQKVADVVRRRLARHLAPALFGDHKIQLGVRFSQRRLNGCRRFSPRKNEAEILSPLGQRNQTLPGMCRDRYFFDPTDGPGRF